MKVAPYARGEKLNSTFWSRNVRNIVKPFVKTITYFNCSSCVFPSTIHKVKPHCFWFLLLEHKFHERRYLVFFTALLPATQTAGLKVFSHMWWFVYLIKLFSLQNSVEFPFAVTEFMQEIIVVQLKWFMLNQYWVTFLILTNFGMLHTHLILHMGYFIYSLKNLRDGTVIESLLSGRTGIQNQSCLIAKEISGYSISLSWVFNRWNHASLKWVSCESDLPKVHC